MNGEYITFYNKPNNESTISALNNFDWTLFRADGRRLFSTIIIQGLSGAPKMTDGRRWVRNAHWVGQILKVSGKIQNK